MEPLITYTNPKTNKVSTFAYRDGIVGITAYTGLFKSNLMMNLVSAYLNPTENRLGLDFKDTNELGQILVIDTHNNRNRTASKIHHFTEFNPKITWLTFNDQPTEDMLRLLDLSINKLSEKGKSIRAIFIDGIDDFIKDISDQEEVFKLIQKLNSIKKELSGIPIYVTFQRDVENDFPGTYRMFYVMVDSLYTIEHHNKEKKTILVNSAKNSYQPDFDIKYNVAVNDGYVEIETM